MIDFERFEAYIKARCEKKYFVFHNKLISNEEVLNIRKLLATYKKTPIKECLESSEVIGSKFSVEIQCLECEGLYVESLSKERLWIYFTEHYFQNSRHSHEKKYFICLSCKEEIETLREKEAIERNNKWQNEATENTLYYIENYLNPEREWNKSVKMNVRLSNIRNISVYWDAISSHIKAMDYYEFLKTPYWKAIAAHTKYKAKYRCQLCNSKEGLATHHRTYEIHGAEHAHMNELIVLCTQCHEKHHDIGIPKDQI
jgi:Zn finger protein HypA/HybF involved in hydrogenase expression